MKKVAAAVAAVALTVPVGCGTRVERPPAEAATPPATTSTGGIPLTPPVPEGPAVPATAATEAASTAPRRVDTVPGPLRPEPARAAASGPAAPPPPDPAATAEPVIQKTTGGRANPAPAPAAFDGPAAQGATRRSPAAVATFGTLSGPVGATIYGVPALQAWVKSTNARGGLNGHPVQLYVYDDGGDPARARAQVQEAIERRGVIAFLHSMAIVTGRSTQEYITSKGVPVVGNETGSNWFYDSPMYFPQASSGLFMYRMALYGLARAVLPTGKNKLGLITCVEAQACKDAAQMINADASAAGVELVYSANVSIAQPDFTAECLGARNAGAQAMIIGMDPSAVQRIALACARQNYHPVFSTPSAILSSAYKSDPNLDGLVAPLPTFPFFQSGTPATDEFQRVMRTYAAGVTPSNAMGVAWVSAKLFEKAAAALPEPPTAKAVLQGLWAIKNDNLGGLTHPLTFEENQKPTGRTCWFTTVIRDRTFVSPDNFHMTCL